MNLLKVYDNKARGVTMQQIRPLFCPCLWTFSVDNSHAYFPLRKLPNLSSLAFYTGSSIKSTTKSVYLKKEKETGDYWSSVKSTHNQSWTWQWKYLFFSLYHNCSKLLFGANKNFTNVNAITPPPPHPKKHTTKTSYASALILFCNLLSLAGVTQTHTFWMLSLIHIWRCRRWP